MIVRYFAHSEDENYHFFRAKAAAIPPIISPTAVAVMPIPITPSARQNTWVQFLQFNVTAWSENGWMF